MTSQLLRILEVAATAASIASLVYFSLCLWAAATFKRRKIGASLNLPPVSILKPLKGTDPEMYESFRSQCLQDYPEYEIIFGVSEADDPAIKLVERLKSEFPERAIRFVLVGRILARTQKSAI